MTRKVSRFYRGSRLTSGRMNEIADAVNDANEQLIGTSVLPGFPPQQILVLEIKSIATLPDQFLTCVLLGESANASAVEWTVYLPPIYTELSRGAVSYVYTDINTRTASAAGETDETQYLTPALTVGEVIEARDQGGIWRMLGDGRMWAVDP